jgi:hypothetical protein
MILFLLGDALSRALSLRPPVLPRSSSISMDGPIAMEAALPFQKDITTDAWQRRQASLLDLLTRFAEWLYLAVPAKSRIGKQRSRVLVNVPNESRNVVDEAERSSATIYDSPFEEAVCRCTVAGHVEASTTEAGSPTPPTAEVSSLSAWLSEEVQVQPNHLHRVQ